jgi:hypothetical protein
MKTEPSGRLRKVGVALFCLALLATLFGAFHLIENWRGKKKWEAYKRQLVARGARLDFAAFIPPPVRDPQNFAATPFFAELLPGPKPTNWNRWPEKFGRLHALKAGKRNERQLTDLAAFAAEVRGETNAFAGDRAKAAEELLTWLKEYEPALRELRAASARPLSRYNIYYDMENPWGIRLPHLPILKAVSQLLSVKACAELARGNNEGAMEDVRLMIRLIDSMESELFLINYFVYTVSFQLALQPVWEGIVLDRWSDAQLEEIQRAMLRFNFVEDLHTPIEVEQAAGVLTADLLLKQRYKTEFLNALTAAPENAQASDVGLKNAMLMLVPRGWYYMEQHEFVTLYQRFMFPGLDATNRVVYPGVIDANEGQLKKEFQWGLKRALNHRVLSALLMPAVVKTHTRAAQAQTAAHQAAIACALERYRRKYGQHPTELAALAPEFMSRVPHDAIGGKPMHYKTTKPIAIYSVGWDETDNGGTAGKLLWDERGDWVWTYPERQ